METLKLKYHIMEGVISPYDHRVEYVHFEINLSTLLIFPLPLTGSTNMAIVKTIRHESDSCDFSFEQALNPNINDNFFHLSVFPAISS